jgi:MFS transporter, FHS family, glucose/mannose:H+ symporter
MIQNKIAITNSCYMSMFFLGIGITIIGVVAKNIGFESHQIGMLIVFQNIGFGISVFFSGIISDFFEKPKILFMGSLILFFGFLLFYFYSHSYLMCSFILFVIGIGSGTYEALTDIVLFEIHSDKVSFHITINHFFVTFGSLLITFYLIFLQLNWQISIIQISIAVACLTFLFLLIKMPLQKRKSKPTFQYLTSQVADRSVIVLFIVSLIIAGFEVGFIGFLISFLIELRGFDHAASKFGLLMFILGVAVGRLMLSFISNRFRLKSLIQIQLAFCFIFSSLLLFFHLHFLMFVLVFLNGLSISVLFPLVITLAGTLKNKNTALMLSFIKMALPIGGVVVPFFLSMLIQLFSFEVSLLFFPFICLLGFMLFFATIFQKE